MIKYLRPETLFGNKFDGYLNQKTAGKGGLKSYGSKKGSDEYSELGRQV